MIKNFYIYKSSAGSGKTDTLVTEYLKIALKHPDNFKKILAVTFTNKAAIQMKTRIISVLEALALNRSEGINHIKQKLLDEFNCSDISTIARNILTNILHNYSYFSVSTIDSFFNKILRAFSKELNLQLGFEIELDIKYVNNIITEKLLNDAGKDNTLTNYLENFIIYSLEQDEGWNIDYKIKSISEEIFTERFNIKTNYGKSYEDNRNNLKNFIDELFIIKNNFEMSLKKIGEKTNLLFQKHNVTCDNFYYKTKGFSGYLSLNLLKGKYVPTVKSKEATDKSFIYDKHKDSISRKVLDDGLYNLLCRAIEFYKNNKEAYYTALSILKTIYIIGIFSELLHRLRNYREENKVIIISDINNLLFNIITGQWTPFLYEKTGNHYNYFLIDEFQDTSIFQWNNFKPLIENSISENNFSIIVGDVKQAIYRWRNGNMKLLMEDVELEFSHFKDRIKIEVLRENFRSCNEIIEFNNRFITTAIKYCENNTKNEFNKYISKAYSDVIQEKGKNKTGGFIKVQIIDDENYSDIKEEKLKPNEIALKELIKDIHNLKNMGYRQSDILILVRKNAEAKQVAEALVSNNIDIISNESLLLSRSPYVKLIISLFKLILNPNDVISKAEILYNYLIYIKEENISLEKIFLNLNKNFQNLMPAELFEETDSDKISSKFSNLHLYEMTEALIRVLKLGYKSDIYLTEFLNNINLFSQKRRSDIIEFLKWWDEKSEDLNISIPEGINAVKIMTIHKSKGLQSPIIMIPFANWRFVISGNKDTFWATANKEPFNKYPSYLIKATNDLEDTYFARDYNYEYIMSIIDNLNLLYVALTRAEDKLFVYVPNKNKNELNAAKVIENSINSDEYLNKYFDRVKKVLTIGTNNESPLKSDKYELINKVNTIKEKLISTDLIRNVTIESSYVKNMNNNIIDIARKKGIIIHKALSLINKPKDSEIENALNKLYKIGLINQEHIGELFNDLKNIFKNDVIRGWFETNDLVLNEQEILLPNGKIFIPDKIIIDGNNVTIIDFKTGSKSESHKEQIKYYSIIIEQMGFIVKNIYLVYLQNLEIIKIV